MKKYSILLIALILCFSIESFSQTKTVMKNKVDSLSYGIGLNWGKMLKKDSIMVDLNLVYKGLSDGFNLGFGQLTDQDINDIFSYITNQIEDRNQRKMKEQAELNLKRGKEFLERNKKDPKVITTASGLQYKIINKGTGPVPALTDKVRVHYRGALIDGSTFDSSYDRNEPAEFEVQKVIKGWVEALQLMHEGDKLMLYIPPDLAYGEKGAGNIIGPNETLVFEVELLKVIKEPEQK